MPTANKIRVKQRLTAQNNKEITTTNATEHVKKHKTIPIKTIIKINNKIIN